MVRHFALSLFAQIQPLTDIYSHFFFFLLALKIGSVTAESMLWAIVTLVIRWASKFASICFANVRVHI